MRLLASLCSTTTCSPRARGAQALRRHPRGPGGRFIPCGEYELPRTPLPRTSVNKGKEKGRVYVRDSASILLADIRLRYLVTSACACAAHPLSDCLAANSMVTLPLTKTLSENFSMNLEQRRISPRMGLPK